MRFSDDKATDSKPIPQSSRELKNRTERIITTALICRTRSPPSSPSRKAPVYAKMNPSLNLDMFRLHSAAFEARYDSAFLHWDRAGSIWDRMLLSFPDLRNVQAQPGITAFRLGSAYELVIELDKATVKAHKPTGPLNGLCELADALLKAACAELRLSEFSRVRRDDKRHGTTTLFAAFNILNGKVIGTCQDRHRSREFINFLNHLEAQLPVDQDVHLIMDNYCTHKSAQAQKWLKPKKRRRFHFHFTPTSSSWLNQVERFFALITGRMIRRGTFLSTDDLETAIYKWLSTWNGQPSPFVWKATADVILDKVRRCKELSKTGD
jgi:transposase